MYINWKQLVYVNGQWEMPFLIGLCFELWWVEIGSTCHGTAFFLPASLYVLFISCFITLPTLRSWYTGCVKSNVYMSKPECTYVSTARIVHRQEGVYRGVLETFEQYTVILCTYLINTCLKRGWSWKIRFTLFSFDTY